MGRQIYLEEFEKQGFNFDKIEANIFNIVLEIMLELKFCKLLQYSII